jgi:hypothetical protein
MHAEYSVLAIIENQSGIPAVILHHCFPFTRMAPPPGIASPRRRWTSCDAVRRIGSRWLREPPDLFAVCLGCQFALGGEFVLSADGLTRRPIAALCDVCDNGGTGP